MENIAGLLGGAAGQLGRTFILAGVLPMFVLFWAFQHAFGLTAINAFPTASEPLLGVLTGQFATTLLLAVVTGVLPVVLNRPIIRFFEGYGLGELVFAPFRLRFKRMHDRYYADIQSLREDRRKLLTVYEQTGEYDEEGDRLLHKALQDAHAAREQAHRLPRVPFDPRYVRPTSFGNVWATAEEIPRSRYGMDGMVFWPYMRTVVTQETPALIANLDNQKLLMDVCLHLALVCGSLAPIGGVTAGIGDRPLLLVGVAGFAFGAVLFYRGAVGYANAMNRLVVQTYDLYRWDLLRKFGLTPPDDLDDEYWVWQRLGAFLQRSEPFYFHYFEDNES